MGAGGGGGGGIVVTTFIANRQSSFNYMRGGLIIFIIF